MHPRLSKYLDTVEQGSIRIARYRDEDAQVVLAQQRQQAHKGGGKVAVFHDESAGELYEIQFDQKAIARIMIDLNRLEVTKEIGLYSEYGIFEREVHWLNRLRGSGISPDIVAAATNVICMSYVGEPVRQYNLPCDWRQQAEAILRSLQMAGCCHNDIKCDNLTVLDGRLYLVDFGWATVNGEPVPEDWPKGIGRQHRLAVHRFDDRHAIYAALASAERNEVDRSIVMPR